MKRSNLPVNDRYTNRGGRWRSPSIWAAALGLGFLVASCSWWLWSSRWSQSAPPPKMVPGNAPERASLREPAAAGIASASHAEAPVVASAEPATAPERAEGEPDVTRADPVRSDLEWNALPRTGRDVFRRLISIPRGAMPDDAFFSARMLFRNRELNKADTYIPREDRLALGVMVAEGLKGLREANDRMRRDFVRESTSLVAAGRGVPLRPAPSLESGVTSPNAADYVADEPFDVLVGSPSGEAVGAKIADMPDTMEGVKWIVFQQQTLSAVCLTWFHERGLVSNAEYTRLIDRVLGQDIFHAQALF